MVQSDTDTAAGTVAPERPGTRQRILDGAFALFRRQGYAATGLKAVLAEAGAPYGSLYHFFPGGKQELGVAVLDHGGRIYLELVEAFYPPGVDLVEATAGFFEGAAQVIEATDFADACPIATMALEVACTDEPMRQAAAAAFTSWLDVLVARLVGAGVDRRRADEVAVELFCAIEGAFLLSRVTRTAEPLRITGRSAATVVAAALAG
jgi:TetR/AcrR family transcriptional regulator, lmrAB and yxaGH operons repressor